MDAMLERLYNKVSMLMEGDEMSLLFNIVRKDLAEQIMYTQPSETEKREDLYLQAHGVTLLERKMAAIKQEIDNG